MRQLQPIVKTYDWGMSVYESMASFFTSHSGNLIAELWWGHPHVITKETLETRSVPFLLKLLFVAKPLSLQVHPTVDQIQQHGGHFVDPLPKPEIIIAMTDFEVLCGFLSPEQIHTRISKIPSLSGYPHFQSLFEKEMDELDLLLCATRDYATLHPSEPHCRIFLSLLELYPSNDPAVLCPFYMNYVVLKKGECLIIPASQPHCYLSGQGVE